MTKKSDSIVRARINKELKNQASIILSTIGLTLSDAFRLLLIRVVNDRSLPFEPTLRPTKEEINDIIVKNINKHKKIIKNLEDR